MGERGRPFQVCHNNAVLASEVTQALLVNLHYCFRMILFLRFSDEALGATESRDIKVDLLGHNEQV